MARRILFISSADPLHGPGRLMLDAYEAMKRGGYEVDFYTQFTVPGHPEIRAFCGNRPDLRTRIRNYVFTRMQKPAYYFFYQREECPPVPTSHILKQLSGHYDLIYIGFWQGLLSFETVDRIQEKFQAPVAISAVDCSLMTGGCHYPHDCTRFKERCGRCQGLKTPLFDTFTQHNIAYRTSFYDKVNPVIICNLHSERIFRESTLLRNRRLVHGFPIIDESFFCPKNKVTLRKKYGIPDAKKYILLAGVQNFNDDRKGGKYLVKALNLFSKSLSVDDKESILLLTVGNLSPEMEQIQADHRSLGYVSIDTLAELFALADLFLSPSVEDAGPMMVNQALSCGTPVVSFQVGTALEVVDGKGTGYCARLRDDEDFAEGICQHFRMTPAQRNDRSRRCREVALETTSFDAYVHFLDLLFETVEGYV